MELKPIGTVKKQALGKTVAFVAILLMASRFSPISAVMKSGLFFIGIALFCIGLWLASLDTLLQDRAWKHKRSALLGATFVVFFITNIPYYSKPNLYDAEWYYTVLDPVFDAGESLLVALAPIGFRGYVFELFPQLAKRAFEWAGIPHRLSFILISCTLFAFFFSFLLPSLQKKIFNISGTFISELFVSILCATFFPGLFTYSLSDFYALMVLFLMVWFIALFMKSSQSLSIWQYAFYGFGAGASAYACYSIRSIYSVTIILALGVILLFMLKSRNIRVIVALAGFILGALIVSIPQVIVNYTVFGYFKPFLASGSIIELQLTQGLAMERYETYVNYPNDFYLPMLAFWNPRGVEMYKEIVAEGVSLQSLFGVICRYPFSALQSYARHFISLFNNCYGEILIYDLQRSRLPETLGSFLLYFSGFTGISFIFKKNYTATEKGKRFGAAIHWLWDKGIYLTLLCVTSALTIVCAFESRFAMPFYVCFYIYWVWLWQKKDFRKWFYKLKWPLLLLATVLFSGFYYLCMDSFQNIWYEAGIY